MNPSSIDKRKVLNLLRAKLEADLRNFTTSQNAAQAGAVHEETRQEDPKDTRAGPKRLMLLDALGTHHGARADAAEDPETRARHAQLAVRYLRAARTYLAP